MSSDVCTFTIQKYQVIQTIKYFVFHLEKSISSSKLSILHLVVWKRNRDRPENSRKNWYFLNTKLKWANICWKSSTVKKLRCHESKDDVMGNHRLNLRSSSTWSPLTDRWELLPEWSYCLFLKLTVLIISLKVKMHQTLSHLWNNPGITLEWPHGITPTSWLFWNTDHLGSENTNVVWHLLMAYFYQVKTGWRKMNFYMINFIANFTSSYIYPW